MKLRMEARYYRAIPLDQSGYGVAETELDSGKTALVAPHSWDIGGDGGQVVDQASSLRANRLALAATEAAITSKRVAVGP